MKALLWGEESTKDGILKVMEYFFSKLQAKDARSRQLGLKVGWKFASDVCIHH